MFKKSQAALEFLTTYAWAFLVILIMVGALAYFGVLSPSKLLPDRCNFGSEIACDKSRMIVNNEDGAIAGDGALPTLKMSLTNNFGTTVKVTDANVITDVAAITGCTEKLDGTDLAGAGEKDWPAGKTFDFTADCTGGNNLMQKEKIKMSIDITYYPISAGATYTKNIFGEIFTTIQ